MNLINRNSKRKKYAQKDKITLFEATVHTILGQLSYAKTVNLT